MNVYDVPSFLNRLRSIVETASGLPTREVYVMDSGIAAIIGASMDFQLRGKKKIYRPRYRHFAHGMCSY